ncbi:11941_t:CDS:2 [Funneliformis caledonium]|uniref:Glucose-6-phosphate 1-epimerase n=1 Tax=Funneliformis caledonium TaxID=1117310 RepID=A0A9N8Z8Y8_9GLOM|nr:11941_t:CDS:2 [Funneliformis caledonium]
MSVKVLNDKVILEHAGSSVEIYYYGATVTSWNYRGKELIFLSKKSFLDGTKAIRGGIPIVFPQFAKASDPSAETAALPQHGIARISNFELLEDLTDSESVSIKLGLSDSQISESLRKFWPKKFKLIYTVTLKDGALKTDLTVKNEDSTPFDFQALLHVYYSVPDISKLSVEGLINVSYIDKVNKFAKSIENDQFVKITQPTDRIYLDVPTETIKIHLSEDFKEGFTLQRNNLKDTVVWNPWIETAKSLTDFDDDEYKQMVCVEPGHVSDYVNLKPGESWECGQIIEYKP